MRQVEAAERSVPVGAVALSPVECRAGFRQPVCEFPVGVGDGQLFESFADAEHPAVHLVGFRILVAEVPPEAAAYKV